MVFAQSGYGDQAAICAEKCIRDSKSLQARISYWALPVTLAYSLQVVKTLNNQALFNEGVPLLSLYADHYPIVNQMVQILSSKNLDSNSGLDLPLQGLGSVPFGLPGVPAVQGVNMGVDMTWFPPVGMPGVPGVPAGLLPGMFSNVMSGIVPGLVGVPVGMNNGAVPQAPHSPEPPPMMNSNDNPTSDSPDTKPNSQLLSLPLPIMPPHINSIPPELNTSKSYI